MLQARGEAGGVRYKWRVGPDEQVVDAGHKFPHRHVREGAFEGGDDGLHVLLPQRVGLYPGRDQTSGRQVFATTLKELCGE